MSYRDADGARVHRIEVLRETIAERRADIGALLLSALPADIAARYNAYDELAEEEPALQGYLALVDEILAQAPSIERAYNALPSGVDVARCAAPRSLPFMHDPPMEWPRALKALPRLLSSVDPSAQVQTVDEHIVDAALSVKVAPIALRMQPDATKNNHHEIEIAAATSLPRSAPELTVRPLTFIHGFTTVLRIHRDRRIGDGEFDNRFLVLGDAEVARRMLTKPLRTALLRVAAFDVPRLEIGEGLGRITFRWDVEPKTLLAAIDVLVLLRQIKTAVSMLPAKEQT